MFLDHMSLPDFTVNILSKREDRLTKLSYVYFEVRSDRVHRISVFISLTNRQFPRVPHDAVISFNFIEHSGSSAD